MTEHTGLRRKDTTKGPPLRVLSLDGGGVRGYSMLILLQELMHRVYVECEGKAPKRDQIPKPCDYFDLIAGTGTGGLIAIMLGRLRLDLETCKEVYVRMTKRVFETDKTIAGIPYRSTLFKASKLEDAIRDCVREHTIFEDEGNDGTARGGREAPLTPLTASSGMSEQEFKRMSIGSSTGGFSPVSTRSIVGTMRWGNPNAYLYDSRENRTKTAVTALYKGTPRNGAAALLRSYDSRKEPAPEFNCTIWQAGRATSATGLAFKPIQIGQSVFIDEGHGNFNPSPQIMDEAAVNEWPGREIGVFLSIGTGKRPGGTSSTSHEWWEDLGGSIGDFAEAKRRLIAKIEGCEDTHQYMRTEHLAKRGVNPDNYYRLNVEVGVGEFGMNEWSRLADISTSTRRYVAKQEVQRIINDAGAKMARIERAKRRHTGFTGFTTINEIDGYEKPNPPALPPLQNPLAVELPGDDGPPHYQRTLVGSQHGAASTRPYRQVGAPQDKFAVLSDEYPQVVEDPPNRAGETQFQREDRLMSENGNMQSPRRSHESYGRAEPPPLPPKTPIQRMNGREFPRRPNSPRADGVVKLPYPDTDGPPPLVNMARKPEYIGR